MILRFFPLKEKELEILIKDEDICHQVVGMEFGIEKEQFLL